MFRQAWCLTRKIGLLFLFQLIGLLNVAFALELPFVFFQLCSEFLSLYELCGAEKSGVVS